MQDSSIQQINQALHASNEAFRWYSKCGLQKRRELLYAIASAIESLGDLLIETAAAETRLTTARLRNERSRTIRQLTEYADYAAKGWHLDIRIDRAITERNHPRPDIRKMNIPIGPVVVFGASNFPFAYSTAGGDTASALAAGCPVVVKAHPAHALTSQLVADAISGAIEQLRMPSGIFQHLHGASPTVGETLVKHPLAKAVGFTGSFEGGKQLFDWGNQRAEPIPVFAEMGSVNPVYLFPDKLSKEGADIADMYASSISLSAGQFCTNPGILVAVDNEHSRSFARMLAERLQKIPFQSMLHSGIHSRFEEHKENALSQKGVSELTSYSGIMPADRDVPDAVVPCLAVVHADRFLENPTLYKEVFGPYSLLVLCSDMEQLKLVARSMPGQLTSSILATENELPNYRDCIDEIEKHAGRLIMNGVPTGVEVVSSMQHGGPYPATTDSRFTAVGPDAIRRFVRPVCYQNWPNQLLPDELKDENTLGMRRMINGEWE